MNANILKFCLLSLTLLLPASTWARQCVGAEAASCHEEVRGEILKDISGDSASNYLRNRENYRSTGAVMSWTNAHCNSLSIVDDCEEADLLGIQGFGIQSLGILKGKNFVKSLVSSSAYEGVSNQSRYVSEEEKLKCACIESSYLIANNANAKVVKKFIDAKMEKLENEIFSSFGKKIINDYAHIYEDGIYFLNENKMISQGKKDELLCRGSDQFTQAIKNRCPGMSEKKVKERIASILSGIDLGEDETLESKLKSVDLLTVHRRVSSDEGTVVYARTEYDKFRYGLKSSQKFKKLDATLSNLFTKDDALRRLHFEFPLLNGVEAISRHLGNLFIQDFDKTVRELFSDASPEMIANWKKLRDSKNPLYELENQFAKDILMIAPSNPGLSAILLDPALFSNYLTHTKDKKMISVIDDLETNFSEIGNYLLNRCKTMTDSFAEVVCMDRKDVLGGVSKESLKTFVQDDLEDLDVSGGIRDILQCRGGQNNIVAFKELNKDGSKIINSDAFSVINKVSNDGFSKAANDFVNDETKREVIASTSSLSNPHRNVQGSFDPMRGYAGVFKKDKFIDSSGQTYSQQGSELMISEKTQPIPRETLTHAPVAEMMSDNQVFNKQYAFVNDFKDSKDSKEIVNFLSNREDQDEVITHVSNLKDNELKELEAYRLEALKQKEDSLKAMISKEKMSIGNLKSQIDTLIAGKGQVYEYVNNKNLKTGSIAESDISHISKVKSLSSEPLKEKVSTNKINESSRAPASVFSGTGGVSSGAMSSRSNKEARGSLVQTDIKEKSSTGLVVQEEKKVIIKNAKEITERIVDYLKNADSDTFLQFTKEGVVYKYQAVENGVVVEKEVHISMDDVDPKMLAEIMRESENKITKLQRRHSFESLKVIISEEVMARNISGS